MVSPVVVEEAEVEAEAALGKFFNILLQVI